MLDDRFLFQERFRQGHEASGLQVAQALCFPVLELNRSDDETPGELVHTLGDAHLYLNHLEQAELQLGRKPYPLPEMRLNPERHDIFEFEYPDFHLVGYRCHAKIPAPIAV